MRRLYWLALCGGCLAVMLASLNVAPVQAFPEFKKAFDNKYVKADGSPEEKALATAVEGAKCGICHEGPQGKEKKKRNAYGKALSKLIKKADKKDADKIDKAFDTVAKEPSDPADAASPTFGDLIHKGELPVK